MSMSKGGPQDIQLQVEGVMGPLKMIENKWVTRVITNPIGFITSFKTDRGPTCFADAQNPAPFGMEESTIMHLS